MRTTERVLETPTFLSGRMFLIAMKICIFVSVMAGMFLYRNTANAQLWNLRDEHGDTLPTHWPPISGTYESNTITIWFNQSTINQAYLCNYWWLCEGGGATMKQKKNGIHIQEEGGCTGVMLIDTSIILDSNLVTFLWMLGADSMQQYTDFSPCEDTLSYTQLGDTIRTPLFWNCFKVSLTIQMRLPTQ